MPLCTLYNHYCSKNFAEKCEPAPTQSQWCLRHLIGIRNESHHYRAPHVSWRIPCTHYSAVTTQTTHTSFCDFHTFSRRDKCGLQNTHECQEARFCHTSLRACASLPSQKFTYGCICGAKKGKECAGVWQ